MEKDIPSRLVPTRPIMSRSEIKCHVIEKGGRIYLKCVNNLLYKREKFSLRVCVLTNLFETYQMIKNSE